MRIEPFDVKNASPEEYAATNTFRNSIRAERLPDDPPVPLEEEIRRFQSIPPLVEVHAWSVRSDDRSHIVAGGSVSFLHTEENRHAVDFGINVLPECRRQGLARLLLARIVEIPRRENRRLMFTGTSGNVPAGEVFMRRLDARMGMATHTNQVDLVDLDRELLAVWQLRARERASDFDLGLWTEDYPEEHIGAIAAMWETMNLAPRDDLEVEDFHWTPEHLRQFEAADRGRGVERWTMYVRERDTGQFAGMTEVTWHPNRPKIIHQGMTAVLPQYQGRGLGRWFKAAMLEKILRDRPQARWVRTGNADSNAAMLKINRELGFKPYESHYVWQIETDQVAAYLAGVHE